MGWILSFLLFFQLNDTVTAFIGGTLDRKGIVTYNWNTLTYQKIPVQLKEDRLEAGCALITNKAGETLVAVVGCSKLVHCLQLRN